MNQITLAYYFINDAFHNPAFPVKCLNQTIQDLIITTIVYAKFIPYINTWFRSA